MLKKLLAGLTAAILLAAPALAEVYSGVTIALQEQAILAETSGVLESIAVKTGSRICEGDLLADFRTTKVFASQDGTIARIHAAEGEETKETVMELQPVSRYTIHCTVDEAYSSVPTGLVHSGESLYLRCTYNGTHRGTGIVTQIDGNTYLVEATGGEFYVGETVYLYRDADFTTSQRVGIGTVVTSAVEAYASEGKVVRMHVEEGEYVQRGELLYEIIAEGEVQMKAESSGIISSVGFEPGDRVNAGDAIFTLVSTEDICVEVQLDETIAANLKTGDSAALAYAIDAEERLVPGKIISVSRLSSDGSYSVRILPEAPVEYLGMSVEVRLG